MDTSSTTRPGGGMAHGASYKRRPRATQEEMAERRSFVLSRLEDGAKSIKEIFDGEDISYHQIQTILRRMVEDGEIVQVGKDGREVLFAKNDAMEFAQVPPQRVRHLKPIPFDEIVETVHMGEQLRVVRMALSDDDGEELRIGLKIPGTGRVVYAQLVG